MNASRMGRDQLAKNVQTSFPAADIRVVNLPDWHRLAIQPHTLIILTDLSLTAGFTEDIRRKERLAIAWRRLAAMAMNSQSRLLVQGPESLLSQVRNWLTPEGLEKLWGEEWKERESFGYPPAKQRIKLLFTGTMEEAEALGRELEQGLKDGWIVHGPFAVLFRSHTRKPRCIFHLIPPSSATEKVIRTQLEPFAKKAIIDLDPIAFFS